MGNTNNEETQEGEVKSPFDMLLACQVLLRDRLQRHRAQKEQSLGALPESTAALESHTLQLMLEMIQTEGFQLRE